MYESSLCRRFRPVSLRPTERPRVMPPPWHVRRVDGSLETDEPGVSRLVPQIGLADAHDVAGDELVRALEPDPDDEGAVRRADVLEPDPVGARVEEGVARRREAVAAELDVVRAAAPDGEPRAVQAVLLALGERRAL